MIVGAGLMGRWHGAYAMRAGASITAVVDPDATAAEILAKRFGVDALQTPGAYAGVDAVHICTPLASHAEIARSALEAGCHVLCEKPLAETAAETRALLDLAAESDLVLSAVHQFPFQRGYRTMIAHRARLGRVVRVAMHAWTAGADGRTGEARRAVMREILPHPISLLHPLGLDPSELVLRVHTDDELSIAGTCGETSVLIDINLLGRPTRNELVVTGSTGTATVDLYHGYSFFERGTVSRTSKMLRPLRAAVQQLVAAGGNLAWRAAGRQPAYPGLPELIAAFYAAARGGGASPVSPEEMTDAAEWLDRVRNI